MAKTANFVKETCSTFGTGNLILTGAVEGYAPFSDAFTAEQVYYSIFDGTSREVGLGTFDGSNTITRTTPIATIQNGVYNSSSPSPIALSGQAVVSVCIEAAYFEDGVNTAESSATAASASAAAALASETAAGLSETNAANSASAAATSATNALNSANSASTSATNAATSASTASGHATDAGIYASNALASASAAETAELAVNAKYLGAKSSDPVVDNEGDPLIDGALYFDTTLNVLKVYDLGNTVWKRTTPTTAEQTNIDTVATDIADVSTVAGISADVTTVSGISADVTTVAGISTDVTGVAAMSADVGFFYDRYMGASASAPTTRNDGSALQDGDTYWNTTESRYYVYDTGAFTNYYPTGTVLEQTDIGTTVQAYDAATAKTGDEPYNVPTYAELGNLAYTDMEGVPYLNVGELVADEFTLNSGRIEEVYMDTNLSKIGALQTNTLRSDGTNLLTYSEHFDNAAWTKTNATVSANAVTAPDGTLTADKLIPTTESSPSHYIYDGVSVSTGTTYTLSVYAKSAGYNFVRVASFTSTHSVVFDLAQGTIGTQTSVISSMIQPVSDGWYLCSMTFTSTVTGSNNVGYYSINADSGNPYSGDGTSGLYIWGAQLVEGTDPGVYCPTTDTARTGKELHFYANDTKALTIDSSQKATFAGGVSIAKTGVTSPAAADGNVFSGTYTPTLTNTTNIDSSTAYVCQYMRVGNVVTVGGQVAITPTATTTQTVLGISLPIASNFTSSTTGCSGTGAAISGTTATNAARIGHNTTTDVAEMAFVSQGTSLFTFGFHFTYQVL